MRVFVASLGEQLAKALPPWAIWKGHSWGKWGYRFHISLAGKLIVSCKQRLVLSECSSDKFKLIARWTEKISSIFSHRIKDMTSTLRSLMVFSSILQNAKEVALMVHHPDFFYIFNSSMGKLWQKHILPLNPKGTLVPTFVFPCNFLILSPVRVVFALYYIYTI